MIYFCAYFYNIPHLEVYQNLKFSFFLFNFIVFYFPAGCFMALH